MSEEENIESVNNQEEPAAEEQAQKEAEEEENLAAIAKNKNISKRELKEYIKNYE